MVYCSKCGTLNPESATNCTNCGDLLRGTESRPYSRYERRRYYEEGYGYSRKGNGFGLIIAGLFVVIIGIAALTGFTLFWSYFWPVLLVLFGLWLLIWGLRRGRRISRQPPPP